MKWLRYFFAFREANHSSVVTAMKKIESPRKVQSAPVRHQLRLVTEEWWLREYAPEHRKEVA
jgi:hypothetical protein